MDLLGQGGIGRVVFDDTSGPVALPVNFETFGHDLVFQTGEGSMAAALRRGGPLSLEADHFDTTLAEGWSVLVRGHATVMTDPEELRLVRALQIKDWAGQPRPITGRVAAEAVSGRRIRRHL